MNTFEIRKNLTLVFFVSAYIFVLFLMSGCLSTENNARPTEQAETVPHWAGCHFQTDGLDLQTRDQNGSVVTDVASSEKPIVRCEKSEISWKDISVKIYEVKRVDLDSVSAQGQLEVKPKLVGEVPLETGGTLSTKSILYDRLENAAEALVMSLSPLTSLSTLTSENFEKNNQVALAVDKVVDVSDLRRDVPDCRFIPSNTEFVLSPSYTSTRQLGTFNTFGDSTIRCINRDPTSVFVTIYIPTRKEVMNVLTTGVGKALGDFGTYSIPDSNGKIPSMSWYFSPLYHAVLIKIMYSMPSQSGVFFKPEHISDVERLETLLYLDGKLYLVNKK